MSDPKDPIPKRTGDGIVLLKISLIKCIYNSSSKSIFFCTLQRDSTLHWRTRVLPLPAGTFSVYSNTSLT